MRKPGFKHLFLIVATIFMAATLPMRSSCETTAHPEATACTAESESAEHAAGEESAESSHCDSGCTDCGLPCCVGTAVILTAAPILAVVSPIQTPVLPDSIERPLVEPDPLYHPPRA